MLTSGMNGPPDGNLPAGWYREFRGPDNLITLTSTLLV